MAPVCFNDQVNIFRGRKPWTQSHNQRGFVPVCSQVFFGQDSIDTNLWFDLFDISPLGIDQDGNLLFSPGFLNLIDIIYP